MLGIQVSSSNTCHIYSKENTETKQNFLLSKSVCATSYSQKMAVNFKEDEWMCALEPCVFKVYFKPVFRESYVMFMYSSGVSLCFLNKGATSFWNNGHRSFSFAFPQPSPLSSAYHLCRATETQHRRPLCIGLSHRSSYSHWQRPPRSPFLSQLNTKVLSFSQQGRLLTLEQY